MKGIRKKFICITIIGFLLFPGHALADSIDDFYKNLEYLLYNYGNDPANWPDSQQKNKVQSFLLLNYRKSLNDVIFGVNLLGYGIHHSPNEAINDQLSGKRDAWNIPYDRIMASSPDGNKFLDVVRAVGNNLEVDFYNPEIKEKLFVFLKADLHSQFSDVFRNFNGKEFTIVAREINIMGALGSAHRSYLDDIGSALGAAHSVRTRIWVGKKDYITLMTPSNVSTIQEKNLLGLKWTLKFGPENTSKGTERLFLKDSGHLLNEYNKGMSGFPKPLIKEPQTPNPGGVYIDPVPSKSGKGGAEVKEEVLESRPSEDAHSWDIELPEGVE